LPHRLIQLFTFIDDVVLDPFVGSGTTCLAAIKDKRNYIGYDINKEYVILSDNRINYYKNQLKLFQGDKTY
jgi:site-specific DNA-methyltransferase (adenine-specific)